MESKIKLGADDAEKGAGSTSIGKTVEGAAEVALGVVTLFLVGTATNMGFVEYIGFGTGASMLGIGIKNLASVKRA